MSNRMTNFSALVSECLIEIGAGRPRTVRMNGHDLPILRVADVLDGRIESAIQAQTPSQDVKGAGSKVSKPGDIVLTTKGTVGRVALMPSDGPTYAYSPQLCYLRPAADSPLRSRFLYYWFKSADFWTQANTLKAQTDMADFLSLGDLERMHISIPPLGRQDAVVGVLGALDDKIAVNDRIAVTGRELILSHYERALLKEPRWVALEEVASFANKRRVPLSSRERAARPGPYPYYGAAGVLDYVDAFIFSGPNLLVGEDGSVVTQEGRPIVQYVWGDFWVNNHAHVLTGTGISTEILSVAMHFTNVAAFVTGAVQPKLSMSNLRRLEIPIPSQEALTHLEPTCDAIQRLVRSSTDESRSLSELRDTLLPELMSGRLRVRDAEKVVEEAV